MMRNQKIFLVSAVYIIHCFVRPFLISFRVRSPSVQSNIGLYRLSPSYASDEDIKSLYEKAQIEDAEWFQRVLGDNAGIAPDIVPKAGKVEKIEVPVQSEEKAVSKLPWTASKDEVSSLFSLGYSSDDITSMKKSIILVVLESNVKRPRKGLPESWLEDPSSVNTELDTRTMRNDGRREDSSIRDGGRREAGGENNYQRRNFKTSEGNRGEIDGGYKENYLRQKGSPADNDKNTDLFELEEETRSERGSRVGEAFAWNGSPLTDEEVDNGQRVRRSVRGEAFQGGGGSSSSSFSKVDKNNWNDAKDEDSPSPFWPDVEEFKDMLLDESQWRSNLIGDWSVPLIRQETKWRYKLYKNWLTFLDEGLGDGFDVVDDEFREYGDDDDDDEEEEEEDDNEDYNYDKDKRMDNSRNNNQNRNEDINNDRGRGRGRDSSTFVSNEQSRDQSDSIRDSNRDTTRSRPLSSQKNVNNNIGDNKGRSTGRVELSKAEKYDNWVEKRVGANGIWTNIAEEQWKATKEQRLAAERRRREDEFDNDYRYDDQEQRQRQGERQRSLSKEDFDEPRRDERRGERRNERRDDVGEETGGPRREEERGEIRREDRRGEINKNSFPTEDDTESLSNGYLNEDAYRSAWKASADRIPIGINDLYTSSPSSSPSSYNINTRREKRGDEGEEEDSIPSMI